MAPILYGTITSPPVRAVLLTAEALGLKLDFKEVNFIKFDNLQSEFVKMNPQHTVPTLDDNGFIVWDSHAIVAYLVGQYGKDDSLYPKDLKKRATVDQRVHFNSSILFPKLRGIFAPIIFGRRTDIPETEKTGMLEAYGFLEAFLEGRTWLSGNQMTIADLCAISSISSLHYIIPVEAAKFPNITAWMDKCKALPYYEETNGKGSEMFANHAISKMS